MSKYKALTAKGKAAYIQVLEEIGLFNLPQFNKTVIVDKINEYTDTDYQMALYHICIDMEDFGVTESKQVFEGIEKTLDLKFSNSKFSVDKETESVNIELTLQDKTVKTSIETQGGWVNPMDIVYAIDYIFGENKIDTDLMCIMPNEPNQMAFFAVMPMKLYFVGIKKGIFNKNKEYIAMLEDEYDLSDM